MSELQQAQEVKQKLRKIEMEMFKLRTKQLEMKKDGQLHVSSNSGKADSMASNNFLKFQSNDCISRPFIKYKNTFNPNGSLAHEGKNPHE